MEKKKILIVDDEPHVVMYLETLLQDNGYETVSAPDGKLGFEVLQREEPDMVILDLMMPKKTGHDLFRGLSEDKKLEKIPVIIVSAVSRSHLAVKDPTAIFDKPIDPEKFLATVKQALDQ